MDETWGKGQKIHENHIQIGPKGVGGGREGALPPPPHPQYTEQYARIKLEYGHD